MIKNDTMLSTYYPGQSYQIEKEIGSGAESIVFEGRNLTTQEKVAIKKYKSNIQVSEELLLKNLQGKFFNHLMMIKDIIKNENQSISAIVMDLADGTLRSYMESCEDFKRMDTKEKNKLFLQIVEGVLELHKLQLFHRDLKPQNIVYSNKTNVSLKICDFGFVKQMTDFMKTANTGTRCYQPPEQISQKYDSSVDIWALGVIWCEMLGAKHWKICKYLEQESLDQFIKKEVENTLDNQELDILMKMLVLDPSKRLKAFQVESQLKLKLFPSNRQMLFQSTPIQFNTQLQLTPKINNKFQTAPLGPFFPIQDQFQKLEIESKKDIQIPKEILDKCLQRIQIDQQKGPLIKQIYRCLQINIGMIMDKYKKHKEQEDCVNKYEQPQKQEEYMELLANLNQIKKEGSQNLDKLKDEKSIQETLPEPKTASRKLRRKQTLDILNQMIDELQEVLLKLEERLKTFQKFFILKKPNETLQNFQTKLKKFREEQTQLGYLLDRVCSEYNYMENKSVQDSLKCVNEVSQLYLQQQISNQDLLNNELKSFFQNILQGEIIKVQIKLYHMDRMISRLKPLDSQQLLNYSKDLNLQGLTDEVQGYTKKFTDCGANFNTKNTIFSLILQIKEIQNDEVKIVCQTSNLLKIITNINEAQLNDCTNNKDQIVQFDNEYLEFRKMQIFFQMN